MLQQQQQQQHRLRRQQLPKFPSITKPRRLKLLQDVTQQPYRIGMVQYYSNDVKNMLKAESGSDDDIDDTPDPGLEVVERNRQERMKRIADDTRDELDKVLKRVDNTMNNYEYSVQSSLIQHGMYRNDLNSVEHVADIKELEDLLNDKLAKQRYKQRLTVFIVGQAEKASEKAKLLNSLGQFFMEQKQNFSGAEFHNYDDSGDATDEIEAALQSFDVKGCYANVKTLGYRLNELNEEIIQFLVQNTGTKQTKVMVERGKRKLAQVTKDAKEQLADLQSKLETVNTEMMGRDAKIQTLEKDLEAVRTELKITQETLKKVQDDLKRRETEAKFFKRRTNDFEEIFNKYKNQLGDIAGLLSAIASQSDTEDVDTADEIESKLDKDSTSSHTGREQFPSTTAQATGAEASNAQTVTARQTQAAPPAADASKEQKKARARGKSRKVDPRSKKEANNQNPEDDPGEIYRRSQQLLESLLADKNNDTPDLNHLFKATRGVDLNNVSIDNLPTAYTNLRKLAITRVKELVKELETKEATNKETVQVLKQEFIEHKTTYEKERLLYFLRLDPDDNSLQEEQNALLEKADTAHKLQIQAQKTAEEALNHLGIFMVEQEKLDQQDVDRQTDLVHRHSVVVNNATGAHITPPERTDPLEDSATDRVSPSNKHTTPTKQWQKISSLNNSPTKKDGADESKPSIYDAAQTLKRMSSTLRKTPTPKQQRTESVDQESSPTSLLRKTTQDLIHQKSTSTSRRLSMAVNDEGNLLTKTVTPRPFERTPSMHSRPLTRSNSINPGNRDPDKSSSGERSFFNSGPQSRRVSIAQHRSPVRAEELELLLTKVVNEEIEAFEDFRRTSVKSRTSLREKYMSLLEEKKHQLDDLKQQADNTLSRPTTSNRERKTLESLENSAGLLQQHSTFSPLDSSSAGEMIRQKENFHSNVVKHDQQQQTTPLPSRPSSALKDKTIVTPPQVIQTDQFKVPFFHLYETIYKFRHSIINLLEQNQFISLADRLEMVQQLSSVDDTLSNDFVDNSERVLKDTVKVLQTCMATLKSTINEHESKAREISPEPVRVTPPVSNDEKDHVGMLQEREATITELNRKCQELDQSLNENNKKYEEEMTQNERIITEQQKLIQNLQRELMRVQKRLSKVEMQGVVQPSIMFTRLDAQRNEQTLKQAAEKGKVPETTVNEINEEMSEYVRLPTQQFNNLVKRYIQHRKATELEDRIQSETFDNEAKSVMERMGSFYERRSGQISERISSIRQHRTTLARDLTEKFDNLEHENSIFLVRPIYSYQGRAAARAYMENEKRQEESALKGNHKKKKTTDSRQSGSTQDQQTANNSRQLATVSSTSSASDEEERLFQIEKTFSPPRPTPASQQSAQNLDGTGGNTADQKSKLLPLMDMTRLEEFDIQRTLLPMTHASVPLTSSNTTNEQDLMSSSLHLRSYVPLQRNGVGVPAMPVAKSTSEIHQVSREGFSALSTTSRITNPRTPFNSTVGDLRKTSPPLPPIKRSMTTSASTPIDEKDVADDFIPSVSINEFAQSDRLDKDEHQDEK